jgi:hypothetical protein
MATANDQQATWIPAMNGYVCHSCGIPRQWNGTAWVNAEHKPTCAAEK